MTKERRLGRGLAALLGTPVPQPGIDVVMPQREPSTSAADPSDEASAHAGDELLHLNVYEIDNNPFQPRRDFSEPEIASLAESLKTHDMLQPVLVRLVNGRYQLISGERRLRAAIQAGWSTVPARVREADDRLVAELAIVENLQREDLNAVEKALSFRRYLDQHGCTHDELASRLKIDRATITNLLRLLELPSSVHDAIRAKTITAGHARALLPLGDDRQQSSLCERIVTEGLSVRQVEEQVAQQVASDEGQPISLSDGRSRRRPRNKSEQVAALEQELRAALGARVEIRTAGRGRGKIVVHFRNHEEYDRLHDHLTGQPTRERTAG